MFSTYSSDVFAAPGCTSNVLKCEQPADKRCNGVEIPQCPQQIAGQQQLEGAYHIIQFNAILEAQLVKPLLSLVHLIRPYTSTVSDTIVEKGAAQVTQHRGSQAAGAPNAAYSCPSRWKSLSRSTPTTGIFAFSCYSDVTLKFFQQLARAVAS